MLGEVAELDETFLKSSWVGDLGSMLAQLAGDVRGGDLQTLRFCKQ